jgi:hypothetical protein
VSLWQTPVSVQPGEKTADAAPGKRNAGVGSAIIKIDGVPVRADGLSAGENDVIDVSDTFIGGFRSEYPGISALQANLWLLQIEEREAKAINAA